MTANWRHPCSSAWLQAPKGAERTCCIGFEVPFPGLLGRTLARKTAFKRYELSTARQALSLLSSINGENIIFLSRLTLKAASSCRNPSATLQGSHKASRCFPLVGLLENSLQTIGNSMRRCAKEISSTASTESVVASLLNYWHINCWHRAGAVDLAPSKKPDRTTFVLSLASSPSL